MEVAVVRLAAKQNQNKTEVHNSIPATKHRSHHSKHNSAENGNTSYH